MNILDYKLYVFDLDVIIGLEKHTKMHINLLEIIIIIILIINIIFKFGYD